MESYLYMATDAIFLQGKKAKQPLRVSPESIYAVMPHWSPDGESVVFDGNGGDGWELYLIRPDGTGLTRLTKNDTVDSNATWAPDGRRLAYKCTIDGVSTVCVLELETRQTEALFLP